MKTIRFYYRASRLFEALDAEPSALDLQVSCHQGKLLKNTPQKCIDLIRIDNFLESLNDHLDGLNEGLEKLKRKEREIEAELSKDESFVEQIEEYKKKVETIDRKLGVKKQ